MKITPYFSGGITPGTAQAEKVLVPDSNKDLAGLRNLTITGNFVTSEGTIAAAELGYIDGLTPGTVTASKALVVGSSKELSSLGNLGILGTLTVGVDDTGYDVKFFGATAGCSWLWDESADQVVLTRTSASTAGGTSVEPFVMSSTMTGIGGVGGRARFRLDTNVALGSWSNALKAHAVYGSAGKTTGLGSAFVAELDLSAGTVDGTYAPLELELNLPASASTGTQTSLMYASVNGANKAAFDTSGFLFSVAGLTAASGKIFNNGLSQAVTASARIRVNIGGTEYFIPLCAAEALTS